MMTGGQEVLFMAETAENNIVEEVCALKGKEVHLRLCVATPTELEAHQAYLTKLRV
jgi:hypothetical protein